MLSVVIFKESKALWKDCGADEGSEELARYVPPGLGLQCFVLSSAQRQGLKGLDSKVAGLGQVFQRGQEQPQKAQGNVILNCDISRCCCSVAQSSPTLCDPMDCSTPGLPVPNHF